MIFFLTGRTGFLRTDFFVGAAFVIFLTGFFAAERMAFLGAGPDDLLAGFLAAFFVCLTGFLLLALFSLNS